MCLTLSIRPWKTFGIVLKVESQSGQTPAFRSIIALAGGSARKQLIRVRGASFHTREAGYDNPAVTIWCKDSNREGSVIVKSHAAANFKVEIGVLCSNINSDGRQGARDFVATKVGKTQPPRIAAWNRA